MNIAVCVKQVPDTEAKIKISDNKKHIDESEINFILNPYDEFAVEEALKTKESLDGEVTIISLGPDRVTSAIRNALAMGADKAIHIKVDDFPADPGVIWYLWASRQLMMIMLRSLQWFQKFLVYQL